VEVKAAISTAGLAANRKKQALTKTQALTKKQAKQIKAAKRFRSRVATQAAGPSKVNNVNNDSEDIADTEDGESEVSGTEYDPKA
jgi:hypothetical protein